MAGFQVTTIGRFWVTAEAKRISGAISRFAATGAGNVQGLRGIHPPEFRLRVGDWPVRFHGHGDWIEILRVRNRKEAYRWVVIRAALP